MDRFDHATFEMQCKRAFAQTGRKTEATNSPGTQQAIDAHVNEPCNRERAPDRYNLVRNNSLPQLHLRQAVIRWRCAV
jgi:hypothetical protein